MQEQIDFDWYNDNAWFILEQQPGAFYSASQLQLQGDFDLDTLLRLQSTSLSGRKYQWYRLVSHTRNQTHANHYTTTTGYPCVTFDYNIN
jgi:hypothetical protein